MLVVVIAVCGVAVAVVQVVHMVAVRDCYVAAAFTMSVVGVSLGFYVLGGLALVPVAIVLTVDMTFVEVVGVVAVWEGYVAAIGAVGVGVVLVGGVGHDDWSFLAGISPVVFNVFSLNRIFSLVSIAGGEFPQIFLNE